MNAHDDPLSPPGASITARTASGDAGASAGRPTLPSDWPHRAWSHRRGSGGMAWHVQRAGEGPRVLLLHGTGASAHSWAGVADRLITRHEVLIPDLPGHGFSDRLPGAPSLPAMAGALRTLLHDEDFSPELVVGHSAGTALALRLALREGLRPGLVVGVNAALEPYGGLLAPLAQPMARLFSLLAPVSRSLAAQARRPGTVERLIRGTGSNLPPEAIACYRRLLGDPDHVAGTLDMMANWALDELRSDLVDLGPPLCLVVGEGDRTVPPAQATATESLVPRARVIRLPGLGHLAHEERPRAVFEAIEAARHWAGIAKGASHD